MCLRSAGRGVVDADADRIQLTRTVVTTWELLNETALPWQPRLASREYPKALRNSLALPVDVKAIPTSDFKISGARGGHEIRIHQFVPWSNALSSTAEPFDRSAKTKN